MYTYKLKFTIFGKEMATTITAEDMLQMSAKLLMGVVSKIKPTEVTVLDETGKEVSPEEYAEQGDTAANMLIKIISSHQPKFSQN